MHLTLLDHAIARGDLVGIHLLVNMGLHNAHWAQWRPQCWAVTCPPQMVKVQHIVSKMLAEGGDSSVLLPKCPRDTSALAPNCLDTSAPVG